MTLLRIGNLQIETQKSDRTVALEHRDRLVRMGEDRDAFVAQLQESRMSIYKVSSIYIMVAY